MASKRIFVVTGTFASYEHYVSRLSPDQRQHYRYLAHPKQLQGLTRGDCEIVVRPDAAERTRLGDIYSAAMAANLEVIDG